MALFAGKQENKIDAKGRVSLPSFIRAEIADSYPSTAQTQNNDPQPSSNRQKSEELESRHHRLVYLYPSPNFDGVIEGCDRAGLEAMRNRIMRLPRLSRERELLTEIFFAEATALIIDDNGRIQMPADLAQKAGIEGTCYFVGRNDVFEIWHKQRYDERRQALITDPEQLAHAFAALEWSTMESKANG